jgi:hypothetical protein
MAGTAIANKLRLGDSATDSQNFLLQTNVDGTGKLSRGSAGNLGDVLTWDATGRVSHGLAQSMVRLAVANGYGSSLTSVRRWLNSVVQQGSDISYADSATLGGAFTINANGVYAISYTDNFTSVANMGLSLNSTNGATGVAAGADATRLADFTTGGVNYAGCVSWMGYLVTGSVIRAHTQGIASGGGSPANFCITRIV